MESLDDLRLEAMDALFLAEVQEKMDGSPLYAFVTELVAQHLAGVRYQAKSAPDVLKPSPATAYRTGPQEIIKPGPVMARLPDIGDAEAFREVEPEAQQGGVAAMPEEAAPVLVASPEAIERARLYITSQINAGDSIDCKRIHALTGWHAADVRKFVTQVQNETLAAGRTPLARTKRGRKPGAGTGAKHTPETIAKISASRQATIKAAKEAATAALASE